jgi:AmiR/NasT family two-component response regulator
MRVVVVEDEWLLGTILCASLQAAGYDVVGRVQDGTEALAACSVLHPDLVLMDIQMPTMSGIEATRLLMEASPTCVVMLTARTDLQAEAARAGAMGYLEKPVTEPMLSDAMGSARQRFRWFERVLRESPNVPEALADWQMVARAAAGLQARAACSEEEAFSRLGGAAEADQLSLREAARYVSAEVQAPSV